MAFMRQLQLNNDWIFDDIKELLLGLGVIIVLWLY